eukprot:CCRYP_016719-RB/>CCRYP_016719-RB protein AED:0.40 eAED:0.50 QI:0/0.25/0.2/1/0/0/5/609/335
MLPAETFRMRGKFKDSVCVPSLRAFSVCVPSVRACSIICCARGEGTLGAPEPDTADKRKEGERTSTFALSSTSGSVTLGLVKLLSNVLFDVKHGVSEESSADPAKDTVFADMILSSVGSSSDSSTSLFPDVEPLAMGACVPARAAGSSTSNSSFFLGDNNVGSLIAEEEASLRKNALHDCPDGTRFVSGIAHSFFESIFSIVSCVSPSLAPLAPSFPLTELLAIEVFSLSAIFALSIALSTLLPVVIAFDLSPGDNGGRDFFLAESNVPRLSMVSSFLIPMTNPFCLRFDSLRLLAFSVCSTDDVAEDDDTLLLLREVMAIGLRTLEALAGASLG